MPIAVCLVLLHFNSSLTAVAVRCIIAGSSCHVIEYDVTSHVTDVSCVQMALNDCMHALGNRTHPLRTNRQVK